ncbi:hypothetical protein RLOC_00012524 [Lonchura striata]|uniref:Uncharacterized protein n=1 Tax=Lonchura striata TaxID=40157 RepID=A0A218V9C5_9PASE|nr:hypothetical protein RLOC_00012524 [Lonchura striata domestica]
MLKYLWLSRIIQADLFLPHLLCTCTPYPTAAIFPVPRTQTLTLRGSWTALDPIAPPCSVLAMQKTAIPSVMGLGLVRPLTLSLVGTKNP